MKRLTRAVVRSGHLLKTMYGTWSKGEEEEVDFVRLITISISPAVISSVSNSVVGGRDDGIHLGVENIAGVD